ncbi:MAG: creatininase family protein [bacterium]
MDNHPGNELSFLKKLDTLEIGPVRIEKRRLIAPYQVIQDNRKDTFNLEYCYEEDVFVPDDPSCQNLASVMGAQVALNYGLFCHEILFHGHFDNADREFILKMAENTAREIYVKKILEPNPFIKGLENKIHPRPYDSYLQAKILFSGKAPQKKKNYWDMAETKHAVLSSGGKDSLLSYSLARELGVETHAIFVNESGRHWFTALNAYRYFKASYPETARVWTNADRIFSRMLRYFPFIRQDFARIRADEYPLRLWTVAIFLFGVLPLLRKRRIGRLLIGDEFDTTRQSFYQGIPHYDGLYDQSHYFDNLLTRYFINKGWNILQFSLLRPLSEMLVEKILTERYPVHQQYQMSCHATHIKQDRVYPCGKCEKCRRIVGMLFALNADPALCGYTAEQIKYCMNSLVKKGINQESTESEHLYYLLSAKGLISTKGNGKQWPKEHPEVIKLRFDPEISPINEIPEDLRAPLYKIYLQYANGAVKKKNRQWVKYDPLEEKELMKPYPYKIKEKELGEAQGEGLRENNHLLGRLTWPEAQVRFKEIDIALLPVGSIEQHGPHLPLDTDSFDAEYLACKVAESCSTPKPIVLPLIPYGVSYHHEDFHGTISIRNETLAHFVYEIGMSVAQNGIKKLVIINGHGGNTPSLQFAAQMINRDAHIFTCVDTGETSDSDISKIVETPNDVHAGEIETSTAMAIRPDSVRVDKRQAFVPHFSSLYLNFSSKKSVEWYARTSRISAIGVLGDPTKANKEKGERIWEIMIKNLVEFVEHLKNTSLEEIYEKRY